MAKKKSAGPSRLDTLLSAAKAAHQYEVGAGGNIMDPLMSSVRGIRLPSLGLMHMLELSALRDSCTVLIDGEPGASKSSLGIDMFNWGLPYGMGGGILDCENKGAFDIAAGMLNKLTLWLPGHLLMKTCMTVENAQATIMEVVNQAEKLNKDLSRDDQIPFLILTDPLAGTASEETSAHIEKEGSADRGHAGRSEAALWSMYLKKHEADIVNLPIISVFTNHLKTRTEQKGPKAVSKEYNPGGSSQNYHTTIAFKCTKGASYDSEALEGVSYEEIWIKCKKNSRGPTGRSTMVRKCTKRTEDGSTVFWWDWGMNTAQLLAEAPKRGPVREICNVEKKSDNRYNCSAVGMEEEQLSTIGDAVMRNDKLLQDLITAYRIQKVKEFKRMTAEEYEQLSKMAADAESEFRETLAKESD